MFLRIRPDRRASWREAFYDDFFKCLRAENHQRCDGCGRLYQHRFTNYYPLRILRRWWSWLTVPAYRKHINEWFPDYL